MRVDGVKQQVPFYNLDVIISVGYRVKSKNGVIFRQWANKILKDYMLKGYAVNQRRLEYLEKTVKLPEVIEIEDTLEAKQKLVDGLIEVVPYIDDMLLICNEEGKILKMYPNLDLTYDYIAGNCFVIGDDFENAGFRSLTEEEIKKARIDLTKRMFKYNKEKAHINKTNKNNHER
ncbi:MAG: RhuM family protein [Clostridia bacterium]|nr:RhuM family protein [Clostridia bacterium]